jgi:hypothetical protein
LTKCRDRISWRTIYKPGLILLGNISQQSSMQQRNILVAGSYASSSILKNSISWDFMLGLSILPIYYYYRLECCDDKSYIGNKETCSHYQALMVNIVICPCELHVCTSPCNCFQCRWLRILTASNVVESHICNGPLTCCIGNRAIEAPDDSLCPRCSVYGS